MVKRPVLVVEDEPLIRQIVSDRLREEGFTVVEAADGDEAAGILGSSPGCALLFTDVTMPGTIDGLTLATHARAIDPDLPVIIATAYAVELSARMKTLHHPIVLLRKPYRLSQVVAAVRRLVGP